MEISLNVKFFKGDRLVFTKKVHANYDDKIITFWLDEMLNKIDIEKQLFMRENDDYKFFLDFFNKSCILTLKKENYSLDIMVDRCDFKVLNQKIVIDYLIDTDDSNIGLELEWNDDNGFA